MKKFLFTVVLLLIFGVLVYIVTYRLINDENNNYVNNERVGESLINEISRSNIPNNTINIKTTTETELANFSTSLVGDSARINNVTITCNTINETTIKPGETFSFNNTVGNPSPDKGYQEADVIVDTKVEKGYGGGNCQVSTTIYNICLQIPDIEIIERNPHLKKVTYIEEGKDAAVSFTGGLDLKFKNNSSTPLKIYIQVQDNQVAGRIVKIS